MESFLKKIFNLFSNLAIFPYKLHWENGLQIKFSLKKQGVHFALYLCVITLVAIYFAVLLTASIKLLPEYMSKKQYDKLAFHTMWMLCQGGTLNLQVPHLKEPHDVMQLANGTVELMHNLENSTSLHLNQLNHCYNSILKLFSLKIFAGHFVQGCFKKSEKLRLQILSYLSFNCLSSSFTVMPVIYYMFQKDFWQLGSYVYRIILRLCPSSPITGVIASCLGMLTDILNQYLVYGSFLITLHMNMAFMDSFKTTVKLILQNLRRGSGTLRKIGRLEECLFIYSKFRILTTVYNNVFGLLYVPTVKSALSLMTVVSVFISVRLSKGSPPLVGLFGITCAIICISALAIFILFTAMIYEYSVKIKNNLRHGNFQSKISRRLIRAFRVEAVKSGNFYDIQGMTCLTVLGFLSNLCSSVLISIQI